jgi:PhnB protein
VPTPSRRLSRSVPADVNAARDALFPRGYVGVDNREEHVMTAELNAYLNFRDTTRQAMEFYASVFGGSPEIASYKDFHVSDDPAEDDKVMHAVLRASNGMTIMAADTPNRMEFVPGSNFSLSLSGDDEPLLSSYFAKLAEGGVVTMPLEKAPWGDTFGMLKDRFGVSWLVNITHAG